MPANLLNQYSMTIAKVGRRRWEFRVRYSELFRLKLFAELWYREREKCYIARIHGDEQIEFTYAHDLAVDLEWVQGQVIVEMLTLMKKMREKRGKELKKNIASMD